MTAADTIRDALNKASFGTAHTSDYNEALAALEAVAQAARHVVDGTDPDGYLNLRAALERLDAP